MPSSKPAGSTSSVPVVQRCDVPPLPAAHARPERRPHAAGRMRSPPQARRRRDGRASGWLAGQMEREPRGPRCRTRTCATRGRTPARRGASLGCAARARRAGGRPSRPTAAREALGWPKRCKLARAFLWEYTYSYERLKLAQLLGQLSGRLSHLRAARLGRVVDRVEAVLARVAAGARQTTLGIKRTATRPRMTRVYYRGGRAAGSGCGAAERTLAGAPACRRGAPALAVDRRAADTPARRPVGSGVC